MSLNQTTRQSSSSFLRQQPSLEPQWRTTGTRQSRQLEPSSQKQQQQRMVNEETRDLDRVSRDEEQRQRRISRLLFRHSKKPATSVSRHVSHRNTSQTRKISSLVNDNDGDEKGNNTLYEPNDDDDDDDAGNGNEITIHHADGENDEGQEQEEEEEVEEDTSNVPFVQEQLLSEELRQQLIEDMDVFFYDCQHNQHRCHQRIPTQWYTCGYLKVYDHVSGTYHVESQRYPIECILYFWMKYGQSPQSRLKIIGVQFDDPNHPCDWGLAPHVEGKTQNSINHSNISETKLRNVGREEMVNVLMVNVRDEDKASEQKRLSKMTNAQLCKELRVTLSNNYETLREAIIDWANHIGSDVPTRDIQQAAETIGVSYTQDELTTAAGRKQLSTRLLLKLTMFEPTGFQKWLNWFKQRVTKPFNSTILNRIYKFSVPITIIALASLCIIGGHCGEIQLPVDNATELLSTIANQYETASTVVGAGQVLYSNVVQPYFAKTKNPQPPPTRPIGRHGSGGGSGFIDIHETF